MVKILAYNIFDEKIWLELPDNGELTPEARWIFGNGHCHSFALAIRKLTGWKLVVKNHKNLRGQINHVLVAVGNRTPLTLIDSEKTLVLPDPSPDIEGVTYKFRGRGWLKAEVEIALPFARTRLAELEHESANAHYPVRHPALVMKLKPKSKSVTRALLKTATNKQLVK
jgi:hypothetical protein